MYQALADIVVTVHFAFIIFVMVGGLLVLRWPRVAWLHLSAVLWGALVELMHWTCPLTPLENYLRERAGGVAYEDDFIMRYLLPVIYPDQLTPALQTLFGVMVIAVNGLIYYGVLRRRGRKISWLAERLTPSPLIPRPASYSTLKRRFSIRSNTPRIF